MLKAYTIILLVIFSQLPSTAFSQTNSFAVSSQFRLRPEYRHGYKTLMPDTAHAAFFIAHRARLAFEFKSGKVTTYVSIQDSRTWGDENQSSSQPALSVNQLWIDIPINKKISIKAGKQELVYDDQRLLGNMDWSNVSRSHDAFLIKYADSSKKLFFHIGAAFNNTGEPLFELKYPFKNYRYLNFAWVKKQSGNHTLSFLEIINTLNSATTTSEKIKTTITFGPVYNFESKKLKAIIGAYYQTGKTALNENVTAYMLNVYAEKGINKYLLTGAGFDMLSGNNNNTPAHTTHSFSTLYATNHKFYGGMDYFINIPADTKQRGLLDPYFRVSLQKNKVKGTIDFHHFLLAHKLSPLNDDQKQSPGDELGLLLDYKFNPIINCQVGYAMMFSNSTMELLKSGNSRNFNNWFYVMLKVSQGYLIH